MRARVAYITGQLYGFFVGKRRLILIPVGSGVAPSTFTYRRPGGVDTYRRPDTTSLFKRP